MTQSARWLIPAYVYPTLDPVGWQALAELGSRAVVVVNPNSGPGSWIDANYQRVVQSLRDAGVAFVGYSDTAYGQRSIADVLRDHVVYVEYYGIDGIFLDQMPFRHPGYVDELADALRDSTVGLTVANAGCPVVDDYLEQFDAVVMFENTYQRLDASKQDPTVFRQDVDPALAGRVAHLVYEVPAEHVDETLGWLSRSGAGYVGIACNDAPAAWCSLTAVSYLA